VGRSSSSMWSAIHLQAVLVVMTVISKRSWGMQGLHEDLAELRFHPPAPSAVLRLCLWILGHRESLERVSEAWVLHRTAFGRRVFKLAGGPLNPLSLATSGTESMLLDFAAQCISGGDQ
jgi:hypothetical protein